MKTLTAEASPTAHPAPASLELLLIAALDGDTKAYHQFLHNSLPHIKACANRLVDREMRDDLIQETLIAIHTIKHTYDPAFPVRPWIAGIMRYKAKEAWRKVKHRHQFVSLDEELDLTSDECIDEDNVIHLSDITTHLKPDVVHAFIATKMHGYSIEETANSMGRTASWVKVTVHRAIKTLRNELMESHK